MGAFKENECTACERCGMFMPKILTKYHQCVGSDKRLRPANIPPGVWADQTQVHKIDQALFDKYLNGVDEEPTFPRVKIIEIPTGGYNYLYAGVGFIFGFLTMLSACFFTHCH